MVSSKERPSRSILICPAIKAAAESLFRGLGGEKECRPGCATAAALRCRISEAKKMKEEKTQKE